MKIFYTTDDFAFNKRRKHIKKQKQKQKICLCWNQSSKQKERNSVATSDNYLFSSFDNAFDICVAPRFGGHKHMKISYQQIYISRSQEWI